jgi:hypothetical protein
MLDLEERSCGSLRKGELEQSKLILFSSGMPGTDNQEQQPYPIQSRTLGPLPPYP